MLLRKTRGAVGCGHCQRLGAKRACKICGRPICRDCAADYVSTCPAPRAYELRLKLGRRLLSVDPEGRFGVVYGLQARLFDFNARCWIGYTFPPHTVGPWPLLAPGGRLVYVDDNARRRELRLIELWPGGASRLIPLTDLTPPRILRLGNEHRLVILVDTARAHVIDLRDQKVVNVASSRGRKICSVAASAASDLLALGTRGQVALFRAASGDGWDGADEMTGVIEIGSGEIRWLGVAADRVALIDGDGQLHALQIDLRRHEAKETIYRAPARIDHHRKACISPDGRLVAVADRASIELHHIDSPGRRERFDGHRRPVNFVRCVRSVLLGGECFVSADVGGSVFFWPRERPGSAPLVRLKVARRTQQFQRS